MNYSNYLELQLNIAKHELGIDNNLIVFDEQAFLKHNTKPNDIYFILKMLSADISFDIIKTQPIQLVVISEENNIENSKAIINKFVENNNWKEDIIDGQYFKQEYGTPAVLSNFEQFASGFRSTFYLSGTLQIMEGTSDVENLEIDGYEEKPFNFKLTYQMNGNTQQIPPDYLAKTVKSTAGVSVVMAFPLIVKNSQVRTTKMLSSIFGNVITINKDIPFVDFKIDSGATITNVEEGGYKVTIQYDEGSQSCTYSYLPQFGVVAKATAVASGQMSGNVDFNFTFTIGGRNFEYDMKLISYNLSTAPNGVPNVILGFSV